MQTDICKTIILCFHKAFLCWNITALKKSRTKRSQVLNNLKPGTRWTWSVRFTLRPLCPVKNKGKNSVQAAEKLDDTRCRSDCRERQRRNWNDTSGKKPVTSSFVEDIMKHCTHVQNTTRIFWIHPWNRTVFCIVHK